MSPLNPQPDLPGPAPEELVAYLDGELSPDECRQVEERLASDADYRQQLHDLDQAWEALDSLPSTAADDDFARTTIEMVALAAQQEQKERTVEATAAVRSRRRMWAVVGVTAAMLGFVIAQALLPNANSRLLGELPLISQMDLLDQIQSVDFLRQLSKEVPTEQLATDLTAVEREVVKLKAVSDKSPDVRRQWVEALSTEQKANLAGQQKQFDDMRPEERRRLHDIEQQIAAAPDSDQLLTTLSAYGQWLTRRSNGEQSNLRGLATEDRLRRVRDLVRQDSQLAARRLPEADVKPLRDAVARIYNEYKDNEEFKKAMRRREGDDRPRRRPQRPEDNPLLAVGWALWNDEIDDKTRKRIIDDLSPQAKKHLDQLAEHDGERRVKMQLLQWMRDAMMSSREPGEIEKFFAEDLDPNQQEYLLSLPKDQMEVVLRGMYLGDRFGLRGPEWLGNFNGSGQGPGAGPGRPDRRPNGPPDGPPDRRFDPDRRGPGGPPGPDGQRNPDDRRGPRPRFDRPPFPPPDGPPPRQPGEKDPI